MRLILTGASGFIGRNLLLEVPKTWDVFAVYHRSRDFTHFLHQKKLRHVHPVRCDLSRPENVKRHRALKGRFDACIYLAANGDPAFSVENPPGDLKMTALTVLHFLSHVRVKRLLYVSSGAVYDGQKGRVSPKTSLNPRLPYAISHLAAEHYVQSFCQFKKNPEQYLIVRFFGAYGPYEPPRKIYTRLVRAFENKKCRSFTIRGDGKNWIDAMYVADAVRGLLVALQSPLKNLTFDLCNGKPLTIESLVQKAASLFGQGDIKIQKRGSTHEPVHFRSSPHFQNRRLHFRPRIPLSIGLRQFADFLKKDAAL